MATLAGSPRSIWRKARSEIEFDGRIVTYDVAELG